MSQHGLADCHDSHHDQRDGDDDTCEPGREFTPLTAQLLRGQESAMCDDGREYHQKKVAGHRVGTHPAHHEEDAEQYLEVEHAGERRRQCPGRACRMARSHAVRERDQCSDRGEQHQISKPGVGVEEDVHGWKFGAASA